jgi:hypothetical protein
MARFEITAPDGARYEVEGADEQGAMAALQKHLGPAAKPKPAETFFDPIQGQVTIPEGGGRKDLGVVGQASGDLASGLAKGVAGLAGTPAAAGQLAQWLLNKGQAYVQGRPFEAVKEERARNAVIPAETLENYGPEAMQRRVKEAVPGLIHEPQTPVVGPYIQAAGEFIPGSVLGPGSVARNVAAYGIAPALASEGLGQATAGTRAEPYARAAGAVAGGLAGAYVNAPGQLGRTLSRAAEGMTPAQLDAMEAMVQEAAQAGIPLSRAQAAQFVTGGATRLADLQRVVEGSGGMRQFYAPTAQGVDNAARQTFEAVTPAAQNPSTIGPAVARAAEREIGQTQGAINAATRPAYQAAEPVRVGPDIHAALMSDPVYARALQDVRANPALNATIEHLPDDAVGTIDLVQRRLGETATNARVPGQAASSNLAALNYENARLPAVAAAETATGGAQGSYAVARQAQSQLREQYLGPLMQGPIGKLAERPETRAAIEALFPANPLPNSAQEIGNAVSALSAQNPWAARQLVRAHIESVFNEATQGIQGGANQWGGATFQAALRGNPQQRANLEAAITALPNGDDILPGVNRFLDILAATGTRQRIGSQTAFNTEALSALKQGDKLGDVAALIASGGVRYPRYVMDTIEQWRLGRNVEALANLLTNPQAGQAFRNLASVRTGPTQAAALVGRLASIARQGGSRTPSREQPRR